MSRAANDEGRWCNSGLPRTQTQLNPAILPLLRVSGKPSSVVVEYVQASALFVCPMCRTRREVFIKMCGPSKTRAVLRIASTASVGAEEQHRGGSR